MATSGTFSTSNTHVKYNITINQNWQSIEGNYSNVTVSVRFWRDNVGTHITLYYGLRKSEVLGLKWSAIDYKKGGIKINHTGGIKHTSLIAKNKTKTEASRREYNLLPEIKENLLKVKSEQKVFEKEYQNTDYVFT